MNEETTFFRHISSDGTISITRGNETICLFCFFTQNPYSTNSGDWRPLRNAENDSKFVVTACNAHYTLIDTIEKLISAIEKNDNIFDMGLSSDDETVNNARTLLNTLKG